MTIQTTHIRSSQIKSSQVIKCFMHPDEGEYSPRQCLKCTTEKEDMGAEHGQQLEKDVI